MEGLQYCKSSIAALFAFLSHVQHTSRHAHILLISHQSVWGVLYLFYMAS